MEHTEITAGEIHSPYQWVVADEAARLALVPEGAFDLHKLCLQTDTDPATSWRLKQVSPPLWEALAGGAGFSGAYADLTGIPASFTPAAHTHPYEPANANLQAHILSTSNPHSVTKEQLGLGSVDNTSDADKPVSTATQTALNAKLEMPDILSIDTGSTHLSGEGSLISHMWSSGVVTGGAITDLGNGSVRIAAGEAALREGASGHSTIHIQPFAQTDLTPADGVLSYVRIIYNGDNVPATLDITTDSSTFNCLNICHVARIVREGTDLHIVDSRYQSIDANRQARVRHHRIKTFEAEAGGLIIAPLTTLGVSVTAGNVWYAFRQMPINAFITSTAGNENANIFRRYHETSTPGVFTTALLQKAGTAQYNNSGTLTNLAGNRYATWWWYLIVADEPHLACVVGKTSHASLAAAQAEAAPSVLPPSLAGNGMLIGQTVVQGGTTVWASTSSAFATTFALTASTDHGSQSGLLDNDHLQYDLQDRPVTALGTLATSATIALVPQSDTYTATTNGNTTIAFSGTPAAGFARSIQLRLTVTGTDVVTITGDLTDGGTALTYSGGGKLDTLEITFIGSALTVYISGKDVK